MKPLQSWLFFALICLFSVMAAFWLRGGTDATILAALDSIATDLRHWFTDQAEATGKHTDTLEAWADPTPGASAGTFLSQGTTHKEIISEDHTSGDSVVCSRPPTKSRSDTSTQWVYKWVDEDGQTHMADKRPDGYIASVVDLGMEKQDFTYEIVPDGVSLPIAFQGQLAAGSKRIYDTWHFFLGEENLRQSKIQLLLMGNPDRFDAYYANGSSGNRNVSGFYRMSKNQAVVKYEANRPAQNLGTSFHEISHLITAAHLGPTPPWLTEGLAEYFEKMQVQGQAGVIYPNHNHIKLLQSIHLPRLQDYFSIKRTDWYSENRGQNYAIAWSIVNFLLAGAPGMYALQETVKQAQENFCKPFSFTGALNTAYPGGLLRLEADWRTWLAEGKFEIQQT